MRSDDFREDAHAFPPHIYGNRRTMTPRARRWVLMLVTCGFIIGLGYMLVQAGDAYAHRHAVQQRSK